MHFPTHCITMYGHFRVTLTTFFAVLLLYSLPGSAQNAEYPQDYLGPDFHRSRRDAIRSQLPPNGVAVIFASPVKNRSNDVDYPYHPDPDFYYLTGYREPNAVLMLYATPQKGPLGQTYTEVLFTQKRDARKELYDGPRLGPEGAMQQLGLQWARDGKTFLDPEQVAFRPTDQLFFLDLKPDAKDDPTDEADVSELVDAFKKKAGISGQYNADKEALYAQIRQADMAQLPGILQSIARMSRYQPSLLKDPYISRFIQAQTPEARIMAKAQIPAPDPRLDGYSLANMLAALREIKTPEEIRLLRKAVQISAIAQAEVMKAMHPGMAESEIQGIHEFIYKKYGAEDIGYPSIVGAGANGCVLHYIANNKMRVGNTLVLMDLGAQYRGYTADVTRTIPANGKFTPEQKAIYDLVYEAQEAAFRYCKPGLPIQKTTEVCREVANKGLVKLGIIPSEDHPHNYFPHGVSHHIGLDVHDRGLYGNFASNMVLTVEPGIYIPPGSPCDPKWWGIGVRIEDDILITDTGYELLSGAAPRRSEEIEKLMAEESIFTNYQLPAID